MSILNSFKNIFSNKEVEVVEKIVVVKAPIEFATEKQKKCVYALIKIMQEKNITYNKKYTGNYIYTKMTKEEASNFISLYKPVCQ